MTLEICRICGNKGDLKNIFTEGNDELVEQIRICANIQIDVYDCLPKFVCNECEEGLAFSYRLRKRGEETEKKLRQDLLLTSIEPYSMGDESIIQTVDNNLMEEFCDEEIWIKDEDAVHFSETQGLIDRVSSSNEKILQHLPEDSENENDHWDYLNNESLSETGDPGEIVENSIIEPVERDLIEMIEVNEMRAESNLGETEATVHTDTKKYDFECEVCNECFEKKVHYKEHLKMHDEKRFHCAVCEKWFTFQFRYEEHLKNHLTSERAFPCPQCHRSYTNQGNMDRHIRAAHTKERNFQCSECGDSFFRSDILKMHMAKHTEKRTIECGVCQKKFKTNQSLHYHLRIHENRPEKPKKPARLKAKSNPKKRVFLCEKCDKISHHRTTHLNHIRTHTGEKPFKCRSCDKAFRTTYARSNHELLHTDKRPHQCKVCGTSFRQTSHLNSHMLIHTGDKRHVCEVCEKAFTMRSNLVVHLRTHTGEKPYVCSKCPKKFLLSSQFKRHEMSHMGEDDLQTVSLKESDIEIRGEEKENSSDIGDEVKVNGIEIGGEFHDSQISLYINDIIEENPVGTDDIIVS